MNELEEALEQSLGYADTEAYVDETETVEDDAQEVEATEDGDGQEPEVFQAPEHWTSEQKETFGSLDAKAQEILLQKDKEFQQGYQEKAKGIAEISQAVEPWKQMIAERGLTEGQAIRALFAAQAQLERDPVNGILQIAQSFGIADQLKERFSPNTDDDLSDRDWLFRRS